MDSLKISTGIVKLRILDEYGDERGIFQFNPNDVKAAERFLNIQSELEKIQSTFEEKANKAETADERIKVTNEFCEYFKGLIDTCFGDGSSKILFGDCNTLEMFTDFFDGITPYYQKASEKRLKEAKSKIQGKRGK